MRGDLRIVAVVPARGGTDRVPYLNIKRLGDRPLLAHTLDAARGSRSIDRVVVSTDDDRIRKIAAEHGAEAPFLRPTELAGEIPSLKPVIAHAIAQLAQEGDDPDIVVVLQATSPFREAASIEAALDRLLDGDFTGVVSVTEDRTLSWRASEGRLVPLFEREGRRLDQPPVFKENGAIVVLRREVLDGPTRFGDRIGYLSLDKRQAFTVHDLEDFWMAERLLRQPRVMFRVDGSAAIGMGHVYRSLAIAEALRAQSSADIAFLMSADHSEGLVTTSRSGYTVRVAGDASIETYLEHIRDYAPAVLINDLPEIADSYLDALSHLGTSTVNLVDTLEDLEDIERVEHYAHAIISVMTADRETPEEFYGGPRYAILRSHFAGRDKQIRDEPQLVLLTFGGSDPQGLTLKAARALDGLPNGVELVAVAGPAFSYRAEFEELARSLDRKLPLINEAGGHIAELMQEADVVICSGGMTVYEIAALGTPGIVLAQNAKEAERMERFASYGTVRYLGLGTETDEATLLGEVDALLGSAERRSEMSRLGPELVDGMGAERAAEVVLERGRGGDTREAEKQTT